MQTTPNQSGSIAADRASLDLDLLRYLRLVKQRGLVVLILMAGSLGISAAIAALNPVTYKADAKLLVEVDRLSTLTGFGEGVGEISPLVTAQNPLSTELEIITSRPILEEVINRLNITDKQGDLISVREIQEDVEASILGGADVIQISFTSEDPEAAKAIVNSLANVYIENNIDQNRLQATKALQLLEQQLPEKESSVSQSETALRNFKEENNIISLGNQAESTVQILESLEDQILTNTADLEQVRVRASQLQSNIGLTVRQAMTISDLGQAPAVQNALQELQAIERQRAIELGFYTEEGPIVQQYQAQIDSLNNLLREEISLVLASDQPVSRRYLQVSDTRLAAIEEFIEVETLRLSIAQRIEALQSLTEVYRQRGSDIPRLEQKSAELERSLEVSRSSYQNLLGRLQELQTAESQEIDNARLIEPAVLPEQATSSKKITLLLGGVVGAFLSTAAVALLEIMDARNRQKEESATVR